METKKPPLLGSIDSMPIDAAEFAYEAWGIVGDSMALSVPRRALQDLLNEVHRLRGLEAVVGRRVGVRYEVTVDDEKTVGEVPPGAG